MTDMILGYDAGCSSCSRLAEQFEGNFGSDVQVLPLASPQMQEWRAIALGPSAPWAPTLIEVSGDRVRGWTGARLAGRLGLRLGPTGMWRLSRIIGSTDALVGRWAKPRVTRSTFLKGALESVVGAGILINASSAVASSRDATVLGSARLSGKKAELSRAAIGTELARQESAQSLRALQDTVSRVERGDDALSNLSERLLSASREQGLGEAGSDAIRVLGVRHFTIEDEELIVVAYGEGNYAVSLQRLVGADGTTRKTSSMVLLSDEGTDNVRVVSKTEDGVEVELLASSCSSSSDCGGNYCYRCTCQQFNRVCLFNCCAACFLTCAGGYALCIACALAFCPVCATINSCCNRKACEYQPGKFC